MTPSTLRVGRYVAASTTATIVNDTSTPATSDTAIPTGKIREAVGTAHGEEEREGEAEREETGHGARDERRLLEDLVVSGDSHWRRRAVHRADRAMQRRFRGRGIAPAAKRQACASHIGLPKRDVHRHGAPIAREGVAQRNVSRHTDYRAPLILAESGETDLHPDRRATGPVASSESVADDDSRRAASAVAFKAVVPAQAGIDSPSFPRKREPMLPSRTWIPAFAGMTSFYERFTAFCFLLSAFRFPLIILLSVCSSALFPQRGERG